jgi:NhaA family Na+:H+ antiporter
LNDRPSFEGLPRTQHLAEQAFSTLQRFLYVEAVSGGALLLAATAALIWGNSPFAYSYHSFWNLPITIGLGEFVLSRSLCFCSVLSGSISAAIFGLGWGVFYV